MDSAVVGKTELSDSASDAVDCRENLSWLCALVAMLTAGFFLRLLFFNGPVASDDLRYFEYAEELFRDQTFSRLDHAASRLLLLIFVGFPGVIGDNIAFSALSNVLYQSLADVIVTLFVLRRWGSAAGFVAATYLALAGPSLSYTGTFTPEPLLGLAMCGSLILVHNCAASEKPSIRPMVVAGALAGIAYSIKDTGVLLLPPVLLYIAAFIPDLSYKRRAHRVALYLGGFLAVCFLELLAFEMMTGDFLYKVRSVGEVHNVTKGSAGSVFEFLRAGWWNAHRLVIEWDYLLIPISLAVPAWFYVLFKNRRLGLFALAGLFTLGYLLFGTSSFTRLINLPFQERYVQPILPLGAIALAYVSRAIRRSRLRAPLLAGLASTLLVVACHGAVQRGGALYYTEALRTAAVAIQSLPEEPESVFVDRRMYRGLRHVLPSKHYDRVRLFATEELREPGYYLFYERITKRRKESRWSGIDKNRLTPVLELALDHRVLSRYYPVTSQPAFTVEVREHRADD